MTDEEVKSLWGTFAGINSNAGSIESKYGGEGRVDGLTEGFGKIDHELEHEFNIRKSCLKWRKEEIQGTWRSRRNPLILCREKEIE